VTLYRPAAALAAGTRHLRQSPALGDLRLFPVHRRHDLAGLVDDHFNYFGNRRFVECQTDGLIASVGRMGRVDATSAFSVVERPAELWWVATGAGRMSFSADCSA
jgi:hypothetical protein